MKLDKICAEIEARLKKDFEKTKASGGTYRSLRVEWRDGNDGVVVEAVGKKSLLFAEQGRRPGKMPPEDPIMKWIKVKPIISDLSLRSLSYLIRRKIGREGTKGRHYICTAANDFKKYIIEAITDYRKEKIKETLKKKLH